MRSRQFCVKALEKLGRREAPLSLPKYGYLYRLRSGAPWRDVPG
jgi:hypothetical protein